MAKTIVVSPSKEGDDTGNIQAAFDDCVAAGPWGTVHFTAGQFYTNNVAVRNFIGFVTGEGQTKTFIDSLRGFRSPKMQAGVTLTQFDSKDKATLFPVKATLFPVPALFGFDGGDVSMSDLTFEITAAKPAETWYLWDLPWTDLRIVVLVTGKTSSKFDRVNFVGHAGDFSGVNVCHAILIGGMRHLDHPGGKWDVIEPTRGDHAITNSLFKGVFDAIGVQQLTDGKLTVGGNASQKNVFDVPIAFSPSNNPNSEVEFSYNEVHTYVVGVLIDDDEVVPDGPSQPVPGRYEVKNNTIDVKTIKPGDHANGVVLADESRASGAKATFTAKVADNTITIAGDAGGIWGHNARDVEIRNNTISGVGVAGIYAGTYSGPDRDLNLGWLIQDNDVQQVTAAKARIWLGPATSQCTVSGLDIKTTVLDEGSNVKVLHAKLSPVPHKPPVPPVSRP